MKIADILDPLPPEIARILGPTIPPKLRAEIIDTLRREPPPRLSPAERAAMYAPEAGREAAELRRVQAEADKAEAEAERARAEAASQRRGIRRSS